MGMDSSPEVPRWISPARGRSIGVNGLFHWQEKVARRWPSKTIILGPKEPASKTMQKQELFSHGGETEGVCRQMDGITWDLLMLGTIQGHLLQFSQKPPLMKPNCKCKVKVPRSQYSMMAWEVRSILSKGTMEGGPGNKGFFTYPFLIPKRNGESQFIMNLKLLNWFITCTKFKMTILKQKREAIHPGQLVVLLPHSSSKEASSLPWLQVERQSLPNLDLALQPLHCSQDLYMGHKIHPTAMSEDGYNIISVPGWALKLANSYTQAKVDEHRVVQLLQRLGLCWAWKSASWNPRIYTLGSGIQHMEYDFVTSPGQGSGSKGSGSQSCPLPYMQRCDEAAGLDKLFQHGTTTDKITLLPLQFWLNENYKTPTNLLKGLKPDSEVTKALHW